MGQKIHPIGLRLGINKPWLSRWYANERTYRKLALEDAKLRRFLLQKFPRTLGRESGRDRGGMREAGISRIEIDRAANAITLTLQTAKPGIIIGRGGRGVDELKEQLEKFTGCRVTINVVEVREPEQDAQLIADSVASQIERRVAFRRAVSQAVQRSMRAGAKGVRCTVSGRLGGVEMSRNYTGQDGSVPRQTLRADIDYGFTEAKTAYGNIGVKAWVYRGDILPVAVAPPTPRSAAQEAPEARDEGVRWRVAPEQAERAKELEEQASRTADATDGAEPAPAADATDTPPAPPATPPPAAAESTGGFESLEEAWEYIDDVDAEKD